MQTEPAYLEVQWDATHTSPAIGPYPNITAARRDATGLRHAMRKCGVKFQRVNVHHLRSPRWVWQTITVPQLSIVHDEEVMR